MDRIGYVLSIELEWHDVKATDRMDALVAAMSLCPWDRDDISDIGLSADELNETLEADPEAGVRHRSETTQLQVPR